MTFKVEASFALLEVEPTCCRPGRLKRRAGDGIIGHQFKGTVSRDFFTSGFFHESVSPQPQSIPLGPFQIFSKIREIFASKGAPPVSTTPAANNGNNIRLLRPLSELEGKNVSIG